MLGRVVPSPEQHLPNVSNASTGPQCCASRANGPAKRCHGAARGSTLKRRAQLRNGRCMRGREAEGGRGLRPSRMTARLGTLANRLCCSSLIDRLWPHISPMHSPQKGELARVNGGLARRMSSGLPKGLGGSRGKKSHGCPRRGRIHAPLRAEMPGRRKNAVRRSGCHLRVGPRARAPHRNVTDAYEGSRSNGRRLAALEQRLAFTHAAALRGLGARSR